MLRKIKRITGFPIQASDGEIGKVNEFLFEDRQWTIRYLVVNTGSWFKKKLVLISPSKLGRVIWEEKVLPVMLSRSEVEKSPDITADKPVNMQYQEKLREMSVFPSFAGGPLAWGAGMAPVYYVGTDTRAQTERAAAASVERGGSGDPNLRSTREVTGYGIQAVDGEIGHVEDFIIDDESWIIRYLVIDTRNWVPGKKVLVAPTWIASIDWATNKVFVDLQREVIKQAPEYQHEQLLEREFEERLYRHYDRPAYW